MTPEEIKFPPSERRESRQFEAPPWEQDKYEQLQRKRAEEQPVRRAEVPAETQPDVEPDAGFGQTADSAGDPERANEAGAVLAGTPTEASAEGRGVDQKALDAMLAELAVEEETGTKPVRTVSVVSGALLVIIGCVLVVWGIAAFVTMGRSGAVGAFGGTVLLLFGAGFVAGGAWIGTKHLR